MQDWAWAIYAYLLLLGFFGFIALSFFYQPKLPLDIMGVIIGYVAGWISSIVFSRWGKANGTAKPNTDK